MEELRVNGTQEFMGMSIPIIEGGFGENCKVILAKTISEIHNIEVRRVNELINNNLDEFEEGVDILDLKQVVTNDLFLNQGIFTKAQWGNANNIYLLSEQGYFALTQLMKTDKAKEIRKQLRREYFSMRQIINSNEQLKAMALLKVMESQDQQERIDAMKQYTDIRIAEETKPLLTTIDSQKKEIKTKIEEIEYKHDIIVGLTDDVDILTKRNIINRICKKQHSNYANRYNELYNCFKETYHIDLNVRRKTYDSKQIKNKDKCKSVLDYAERFGHIENLYKCCVKLYEAEVRQILAELGKTLVIDLL